MEADQNKLLVVVVAGGFLTSAWQVSDQVPQTPLPGTSSSRHCKQVVPVLAVHGAGRALVVLVRAACLNWRAQCGLRFNPVKRAPVWPVLLLLG